MPNISAKSLRRIVQYCFAALCLLAGWRFLAFLDWARGASDVFVPRPAGGEAFLPVAALVGLKHLLATFTYDPVHPAGLTIFLAALVTAWLCRKGFCGFLCPIGLASDCLGAAGQKLKLARSMPRLLDKIFGALKYLILGFFLVSIFVLMDRAAAEQFLNSAYNITADARLLALFTHPSPTLLTVLAVLALTGLIFRNALCRWLCPYGALLGLLGMAGPLSIRHSKDACTTCGRCRKACPYDIPVGQAGHSTTCVACGQCIQACPQTEALALTALSKPIPWQTAALASAAVFLGVCLALGVLGGWTSNLPPAMARALYGALQQ